MAHDELKTKNRSKGKRPEGLPSESDYKTLFDEIQGSDKKQKLSLQEIVENSSVVNALVDILLEDGIIKDDGDISAAARVDQAINLYGGVLSALIMLLKEDNIVEDLEEKLEDGILASHRTSMHFGTREVSEYDIADFRQEMYRRYRGRRKV